MIHFKADDGYSYLIKMINESGVEKKTFRIDSEEVNLNLPTNQYIVMERLNISPDVSIKLKEIHESISLR